MTIQNGTKVLQQKQCLWRHKDFSTWLKWVLKYWKLMKYSYSLTYWQQIQFLHVQRARFKSLTGHIWSPGRSLHTPGWKGSNFRHLCWRSTCVVESKQQWAGDGEGEEPHHCDHHGHPPPGAVAGVVEKRHGHCRVPAGGVQSARRYCTSNNNNRNRRAGAAAAP